MTWLLGKDTVNIIFKTFTISEGHFNRTVTIELKSGGADVPATEENNEEDIKTVIECRAECQAHKGFDISLPGTGELTPQELTNVLNECDPELLIGSMPDIGVKDQMDSICYQEYDMNEIFPWSWQVIRSRVGEQESRLLQFTTGTS
ncbi:hypothetical protein BS47DRAFT_1304654 [Hydnum rufescens UP504]|uniref:HECT-type E3 ubiquitin transferase n=1 Tax=Hydnum rufescens UP504 TaxID=1448309 RepID=A0A9P6DQR6_9AGAM|nr:hypothetical protein BS47DRAFT_1304654 [Hydnum rufescens UP504]